MSPARQSAPASRRACARGVLAGLLAALVFVLGLLAVSPEAHALLHHHPHAHAASDASSQAHVPSATHAPNADHHKSEPHADHDDLGCAVTLFAHGVTTPLALPHLDAPRITQIASLDPVSSSSRPSAPRLGLPPARGPPDLG